MKTLKLFNAVVSGRIGLKNEICINDDMGFILSPGAVPYINEIREYYKRESLSGNDLNKTFHKSWEKIKQSSRCDLLIDQIRHYLSTYGSNFNDEIHIPDEVLNIPETKLTYKVIKSYTDVDMIEKCLNMLRSGVALKEDTINDLISILVDELNYSFTGKEKIKNKEAIIKIADMYNVLPLDTMEFFRYIIYRSTGESLLIKNKESISKIKESNFNPSVQFNNFGLDKLSEIFNRFKPLFLAFKNKCPKTINKISKLSKSNHKAIVSNPLNKVTYSKLKEEDFHWLDNATSFSLFKALSACYSRMNGQDTFVYRIRNGKSWVKEGSNKKVCKENYKTLLMYLKRRFDLSDKNIFIPKNVKYALPTSEKMFVGNIPTGSIFSGKKLATGIYWENSWGARDLDLSSLNIGGKIGWNSYYSQNNGDLMYSGDITSAPNGAVEYMYANVGLKAPTLIINNVFNGKEDCGYKIIVGKGDKVSKDYMMNPNNLLAEVKCNSVQKQSIIGMMIPGKNKQRFVLLNFGAGNCRVSGNSEISNMFTKGLYQQWKNPLTFNKVVKELGAKIVSDREKSNIDLSLSSLEKDSFVKIFN